MVRSLSRRARDSMLLVPRPCRTTADDAYLLNVISRRENDAARILDVKYHAH